MPTVVVCPSCGHRFDRPFWGERRFGAGYTITALGLGVLTCPKCKYQAGTRSFKKVTGPPSPQLAGERSFPKGEAEADAGSEKGDSLDDSKYV